MAYFAIRLHLQADILLLSLPRLSPAIERDQKIGEISTRLAANLTHRRRGVQIRQLMGNFAPRRSMGNTWSPPASCASPEICIVLRT